MTHAVVGTTIIAYALINNVLPATAYAAPSSLDDCNARNDLNEHNNRSYRPIVVNDVYIKKKKIIIK